ncbi:TlyA family RNA methyltransferase, partial [Desulfovibrio sp. OttesenSCG-928-C14]|nr:TlyA family RNA methyltransferase [Desulfovibrio sp. OttesenSCG-928-C14]
MQEKKGKKRADELLFRQGLATSQEAATRLIMAGRVLVAARQDAPLPKSCPKPGSRVDKPGAQLPNTCLLELSGGQEYVGRGAYKLLSALEHFNLNVKGLTALDAGASTGGFTDCLLQAGAARIYAVDVGKAQLHEKLLADPRVIVLDQVNLRLAPPDLLPEAVDLAVADLSFISLKAVLPTITGYVKPQGGIIALIKPQFEVESGATVRGVVRDQTLRDDAVQGVLDFARQNLPLNLIGITPARIKGPKGNQEYLAY